MNNALYPGSFDPFTNGHLSILEKAAKLFDKVFVVISVNPIKKARFTEFSRVDAIREAIKNKDYVDRVVVKFTYDTIPARIAKDLDCKYIIRGLRNNIDYNYEEGLAQYNAEFDNEIETVYFRADNSTISSTMVVSFMREDVSVEKYLPYSEKLLKKAL